jgi:dTDP-4-amino-4,6-dideoxygalactose transaminase
MNPHKVTRDFESALCEYTGAPYAVAVNSCTAALTLAVAWRLSFHWDTTRPVIEIPRRTYISVPMAIIHAGGRPTFRDENWEGLYRLRPFAVWDSARLFTGGMYRTLNVSGAMCVSFHASKTLGLEQGGAILHDNADADSWLRKARFDGRTEGIDPKHDAIDMVGWHCYMNPSTAAQGILRLHSLPRHNEPLPNSDYPDLSKLEIFRCD